MTGRSQVGFDSLTVQGAINILKCWNPGFSGGATPVILDANGYPCTTFTGDYGGQINGLGSSGVIPLPSTGPWVFSWPATRSKFCILIAQACTVDGSKTVGSPTISGGTNNNLTITGPGNGVPGSVTFTFSSLPSGLSFTVRGLSGAQQYDSAGSGDWALMLENNVSRYNSGEIFTQAFVDFFTALNPKCLRMMNVTNTGSGNRCSHVKWRYRTTAISLSWAVAFYHPEAWAGAITGTDIFSVGTWSTMASSTAWTPNEPFYGSVSNAATSRISISGAADNGSGLIRLTVSTTASLSTNQQVWVYAPNGTIPAAGVWPVTVIDGTHIDLQGSVYSGSGLTSGTVGTQTITVTGATKGTKFLASVEGGAIGADTVSAVPSGLYQCHYDSDLDRVIIQSVNPVLPLEVQVAIANKLSCDLWVTIPIMVDADYASNQATYVHANLNASLNGIFENGNEVWNGGFPSTVYASNKAAALGFALGSINSFYGLRAAQYLGGIVGPIWSDRAAKLKRVLACQVVTTQGSSLTNYRLGGQELTSYGFAAKPNRPIDFCEAIACAPYGCGANLGNTSDAPTVQTADNVPFLQNLVNQWDAGNSQTCISLIDDDLRQGRALVQTVTWDAGNSRFVTPLAHTFTTAKYISFQVTGGTMYSGIKAGLQYKIASVPASTTFTIQGFSAGVPSGAAISGGSAGTGTVTVGVNGNLSSNANTLLAVANTYQTYWESVAASYDSDRPPGMNALLTYEYESHPELGGPTALQATTLGLTGTNPAASIAAAILAWKNSPQGAELMRAFYNQFFGLDPNMPATYGLMPHAGMPSNLNIMGGSIWSLTPDFLLPGTPYKLYDGVSNFNNRKRLMVLKT